jgi:integrase/recombinase XerD
MNNVEEQLISEVTKYIMTLVPINVEQTKNNLSTIVKNYSVQKVEDDEVHPDLKEKIELFLSAKKLDGLSPLTLERYELDLGIFADWVKKRAEDITTSDIRSYLAERGKEQGWKMTTMSNKLSIIKSFFQWVAGEEFILKDPTAKLKTPKIEKRLPKALTLAELEMLREHCLTVRERALVECMYATGCRLGEVVGLNKDQINQQSMSALVIGKGNKQREVYFSIRALYHLNKYLAERTDDCESLFVTIRKPIRRLTHRAIQLEVRKLAERAGMAHKVSPHVLRHTFATLTLNSGAELTAIQELLGHESPETTLRYARITEERKREQHKKYLIQ